MPRKPKPEPTPEPAKPEAMRRTQLFLDAATRATLDELAELPDVGSVGAAVRRLARLYREGRLAADQAGKEGATTSKSRKKS